LGIAAVMWPVFLGDIYNQYVKPIVFPPVKVYPAELKFDRSYASQRQLLYISNVSGEDQLYVNIALLLKDTDAKYNEIKIKQHTETDLGSKKDRKSAEIVVEDINYLVMPGKINKDKYKTIRLILPLLKTGHTEIFMINYKRSLDSKKSGFLTIDTKFLHGPFSGPRVIKLATQKNPLEVEPFKIKASKLRKYQYRGRSVSAFLDDNKKVWFLAQPVLAVLNLNLTKDNINVGPGNKAIVTLIRDDGGDLDQTLVVSEAGFHKLVRLSKVPNAREFQKWIHAAILANIYKE